VCHQELPDVGPRRREHDGALARTAVDRARPLVDQAQLGARRPRSSETDALLAVASLDCRFDRAAERQVEGIRAIAGADEQISTRELESPKVC
jgi:hypothetical protein